MVATKNITLKIFRKIRVQNESAPTKNLFQMEEKRGGSKRVLSKQGHGPKALIRPEEAPFGAISALPTGVRCGDIGPISTQKPQ